MQWQGRRESDNVDDRRGISGGGLAVGGGVIGIIFILAKFLLGNGDINDLQQLVPQQQQQEMTVQQKAADDKEASFVRVVLADTEDVWTKIFNDMGRTFFFSCYGFLRDVPLSIRRKRQWPLVPFAVQLHVIGH